MEHIFTTSKFSWGHETTPAVRITPPEMKPLLDAEGNPELDEDGNQVLIPDVDNWDRQMEEIDLETMVFLDKSDESNVTVFKFAVDKEFLGKILSYYVQFLDADGRIALRHALSKASDIEIPTGSFGQLKVVD